MEPLQMRQRLFSRDFTLVVAGQIISLFGNAVIRFALLLYFLNQTGSSALYGLVTACAFVPAILLSPVGGILADRVSKRNMMVSLDFFTSGLLLVFAILMDSANLIFLLVATLVLLYGITGAYQPAVQASIPVLVKQENLMAANSVINVISYISSLAGPVLAGLLYSVYGLKPVLWVCAACFFLSAVMELFIRIPYSRQEAKGGLWETARADFLGSLRFIREEKPALGEVVLVTCGMNLFLAAMLLVGLPYLVTEVLDFPLEQANRLYGFAEGILAAGGLAGGVCAGLFAGKLFVGKAGRLIIASSLWVFPMGAALLVSRGFLAYFVITLSCFFIMGLSTVFSIQMMAFVQAETPEGLIGKVVAVIMTLVMCAQPLGNALYGFLFEAWAGFEAAVVFFAGAVSLGIGFWSRRVFSRL